MAVIMIAPKHMSILLLGDTVTKTAVGPSAPPITATDGAKDKYEPLEKIHIRLLITILTIPIILSPFLSNSLKFYIF